MGSDFTKSALSKLANPDAFTAHLAPLRKTNWIVYAKPPFGGPKAELVYLSRYTHRVAISNNRLISADANTVSFKWKDYHIKRGDRMKVMCLPTHEFIRRFLIHVPPSSFHRIRHTGFLANGIRRDRIKTIRPMLVTEPEPDHDTDDEPLTNAIEPDSHRHCPKCGGTMNIIETFTRDHSPTARAPPWESAA